MPEQSINQYPFINEKMSKRTLGQKMGEINVNIAANRSFTLSYSQLNLFYNTTETISESGLSFAASSSAPRLKSGCYTKTAEDKNYWTSLTDILNGVGTNFGVG